MSVSIFKLKRLRFYNTYLFILDDFFKLKNFELCEQQTFFFITTAMLIQKIIK